MNGAARRVRVGGGDGLGDLGLVSGRSPALAWLDCPDSPDGPMLGSPIRGGRPLARGRACRSSTGPGRYRRERLKQQGRLFPLFIFEMLTSTCAACARVRVLRGVDPAHPFPARHRGGLVPQVLDLLRGRRPEPPQDLGVITLGSGQSLVTSMSSVASSPGRRCQQRAAACHRPSSSGQNFPSGSSTVWNSTPLIVPRVRPPARARAGSLLAVFRQPHHSRRVDRGQRGVEANGRSLRALSHRRPSSLPFRIYGTPTATPSSSTLSRFTLRREFPGAGPERRARWLRQPDLPRIRRAGRAGIPRGR